MAPEVEVIIQGAAEGAEMRTYEIPNGQVYDYAEQFARAVEFLFSHAVEVQCALSVLLEGSLAVELYLKSLTAETVLHEIEEGCEVLRRVTASPAEGTHRHDLQKLFDAIERLIRDELQTAYAADPAIAGTASLRDALGRYSDLFVRIRYGFERRELGNLDMNGLIRLIRFFQRQIPLLQKRYHKGE